MTPQERDLIAHLFNRLHEAESQTKDRDAEAAIRDGMSRVPDGAYLLVQTVLIQDMALAEAEKRIKELERAQQPQGQAPAQEQATSFLAAAHGSVPNAGPWSHAPSAPAPQAPATGAVWTNSATAAAGQSAPSPFAAAPSLAMPGASSGFLRSAATTAAGIAGGALLFHGISSLFMPHYGNLFGGMMPQPGLGETVVNNYYGDPNQVGDASQQGPVDTGYDDQGLVQADDQDAGGQDFSDGSSDDGGTIDI
jgi:uncharacterized protein